MRGTLFLLSARQLTRQLTIEAPPVWANLKTTAPQQAPAALRCRCARTQRIGWAWRPYRRVRSRRKEG